MAADDASAILVAVGHGDLARVDALLTVSPGLARARNDDGVSALMLAAYNQRWEIVDRLRRDNAALDVHEATVVGDLRRLGELLIRDATQVDAYSADGFFPLALAAFFGQPEALHLLLTHGADPRQAARNPMRVTALHAAAAQRDARLSLVMCRELLAHGADPLATQQSGLTPLHQAAARGHAELAELLLAHGAYPGARADDGRMPSDLATAGGHRDLAARLASTASA